MATKTDAPGSIAIWQTAQFLACLALAVLSAGCQEDPEPAAPAQQDAGADADLATDAPDAAPDTALDGTAGEAAVWDAGVISVVEDPGSVWHVELAGGDVIARQNDVALLIDPTNGAADGRYAGIYVSVAGKPLFNGTYNDTDCSMFVPDEPYKNQEKVSVSAVGATLTVIMTEGKLSQMPDTQFPSDEPFRWQSTWSLESGGLKLVASGLYYILPPKDGCSVTLSDEGGNVIDSLQLATDTAPFLEYFQGVRTIGLVSNAVGSLSITTDAQILQVEVPSYPNTGLFELDFDHSFKEKGQSDVHCEVVLPIGG